MSPAFSSTKDAARFAALLLLILLLPKLVGKSILPPRDQNLLSTSFDLGRMGCAPYLYQQIYKEKGDVDIAFIGSSRMYGGIDTPYVQKCLSQKLGRNAVVITLGYYGAGFDSLYFFTEDLLRNRKVKMIVINEEYRGNDRVHLMSPVWYRAGDNAQSLDKMPLRIKISYYYAAIQGMPRNLLSLLRPNLGPNWSCEGIIKMMRREPGENPMNRMGSRSLKVGWGNYPDHPNFVEFSPRSSASPSDVCVYSQENKDKFEFSGAPTPSWVLQFAQKTATLARDHQTKLVVVNFPTTKEMRNPKIHERDFWPKLLGADATVLGIPPEKLFAGISDKDVSKLFFSYDHFNKNGQQYFTHIITPTLLKIYEKTIN